MHTDAKLQQGTVPWFEMVGAVMCTAASECRQLPELNVSLLERYTDGIALSDGVMPGLRFTLSHGAPSFSVGARHGESADIEITLSSAAARTLNLLYSADPRYPAAIDNFLRTGELRVKGDLTRLGDWLHAVHDTIVDRTA